MKTLHIINAPQTIIGFNPLLSRFSLNDGVIFIQDGCYSLNAPAIIEQLQQHDIVVFAIADDLRARNVQIDHSVNAAVNPVDYNDFVDLTLAHNKTISW